MGKSTHAKLYERNQQPTQTMSKLVNTVSVQQREMGREQRRDKSAGQQCEPIITTPSLKSVNQNEIREHEKSFAHQVCSIFIFVMLYAHLSWR